LESSQDTKPSSLLNQVDAHLVKQLLKYLTVGCLTFSLEVLLFYLTSDVIRIPVLTANLIAFTIVFWFNYLMNRIWSFQSKAAMHRQLLIYGALFFLNMGASTGIIKLLHGGFHIDKYLAKIASMFAIVSWNFIIYKKFVFKR